MLSLCSLANLTPAFAAAAASSLLAGALDGVESLGNEDGSTNTEGLTKTKESSAASAAGCETTSTTSAVFCSAIPYEPASMLLMTTYQMT